MDPFILLIIVFIVAPLIERLLKAGKQNQPPRLPPEQQRPRPRGQPWPQEEPRPRVIVRGEEEDAAATMLPDDLWEILTGEKRAPQQPQPQYEEEDQFEEEAQSLETTSAGEWISLPPEPEPAPTTRPGPAARTTTQPAAGRLPEPRRREEVWRNPELHERPQDYVRPAPRRDAPVIVSLEELEFDDELRHDRFHEKLERLPPAARGRTRTPNAYRFNSDDDLRRAIIMMEVLGPPKGLD